MQQLDAVAPPGLLNALTQPRRAWLIISTVGALLYLLNLGGYPLYTKGEPREAVTVFDIVHGGGVILPMRAGVEIPSKPLLMHWLAGVISLTAGNVNEWTVRLPSAICAIAAMLTCHFYVRRLFAPQPALIAALMLGTTFQCVQAGRGARVDMTLTLCMELAFFEFLTIAEGLSARTTLLYLVLALAVLTKGPIGAALPIMVAAIWIAIYRRWVLLPRLQVAKGLAIIAILGGGWYLAAIFAGGAAFIHKQLLAENLYRLVGHGDAHVGHAHPFYYEEGALLVGLMPWTPLAALALIRAARTPRPTDTRLGYLLIWTLTVLIFYNLPQSKRGVYLLALYPAIAALIAIFLNDAAGAGDLMERPTALLSRTYGAIMMALGFAAALSLGMLIIMPGLVASAMRTFGILVPDLTSRLVAQVQAWRFSAVALPLLIAATGWYLCRRPRNIEHLFTAVLVGQIAIVLAINLVIEPAIAQTLALKHFASDVRQFARGNVVGYFGNLDYGFAFYNGRDLQLTTPLDPKGPALMVSPEDDWKLVPQRLSGNYRTVLRSNPAELDGSGRMLLLQRLAEPQPSTPMPRSSGIGT
jgi:4-amino-4-deoxy-L-arabinose transferase-like glycosyltransferase